MSMIKVQSNDDSSTVVTSEVAIHLLLAAYGDAKVKRVDIEASNTSLVLTAEPDSLRLTITPTQSNDRRFADLQPVITKAQRRKRTKLEAHEVTCAILEHYKLPIPQSLSWPILPITHLAALIDQVMYKK